MRRAMVKSLFFVVTILWWFSHLTNDSKYSAMLSNNFLPYTERLQKLKFKQILF